jgi:hypothetical protein
MRALQTERLSQSAFVLHPRAKQCQAGRRYYAHPRGMADSSQRPGPEAAAAAGA